CFFFQAEDGIRDRNVTGVQTCALPIFFSKTDVERAWEWAKPILPIVLKPSDGIQGRLVFVRIDDYDEFKYCFEKISEKHDTVLRSEERRVGKECRSQVWTDQ